MPQGFLGCSLVVESQGLAAETLVAAMQEHASDPHNAALFDALVGCARAVDESPTTASLWKEYRAMLESVRKLSAGESVQEALDKWRVIEGGAG